MRTPTTNTPATTITGNMHGMSAAFLCGEPGLDGLLGKEPRAAIDSSQLELFGTRSIDKLENDLLRHRRISMATCARSTSSASGADPPRDRQGESPRWIAAC